MAVRKVLYMGNPLLRRIAKPVTDFSSPEVIEAINDIRDTLNELKGIGLAAPQIGIDLRIVIFEVKPHPRYTTMETVPQTVIINPEITVVTNELEGAWEGCFSIPGMRGLLYRPTHIKYSYYDENGNFHTKDASFLHARAVQHECDHLDGKLYPDHIEDIRNFGFEEELQETIIQYYNKPKIITEDEMVAKVKM